MKSRSVCVAVVCLGGYRVVRVDNIGVIGKDSVRFKAWGSRIEFDRG